MIAIVSGPAIALSLLQAAIAAPTTAFRGCLHDAAGKAATEKVSPDTIESYLRNACSAQMNSLTGAIIGFRMKNGMGRKEAASDAAMTVDDYVSTPTDNYKFTASQNAPKAAPATLVTPAATPAAAPKQPPKP